jgi:hypothetical protein
MVVNLSVGFRLPRQKKEDVYKTVLIYHKGRRLLMTDHVSEILRWTR